MNTWKKYLFEFVVIFVSITASFLVEEWREGLQNTREKEKALLELKDELKAYVQQEQQWLKATRQSDSVVSRIIHGEKVEDDSTTNLLMLQRIIPLFASSDEFESKFPTYYSLMDSKLVSAIENRELVADLRVLGVQVSAITKHKYRVSELAPEFAELLTKNDLALDWYQMFESKSLSFSFGSLHTDPSFVRLLKKHRVYVSSSKGFEEYLTADLIPKLLEEIDKELGK